MKKFLSIVVWLVAVTLSGCAMQRSRAHGPRGKAVLVIERDCIVELAPTDDTECFEMENGKLNCAPLKLVKKTGCEKWRVRR